MLPEAAQARKAIWEAVNPHTGKRRIDEAFPHELRETTREQEMFIRFKCRSTWQVVGSDNFNSLVGSPPVGVVFSEYSIANPQAWGILRPILVENDGWALFIYTPRGNNHGKRLLDSAKESPRWFAETSPVSETKAIAKEKLDDELRDMMRENGDEQGRALYAQEWECSFDAAIVGAYYVGELELARYDPATNVRRIGSVPHDPALPVSTYWDLGLDDATAVWFAQFVGKEIRLIEYQEWTQTPLLQVAAEVMQRTRYVYEAHVLPHDAQARDMTTGRTREEALRAVLGRIQIAPRLDVADGINAVRTLFSRMWFDEKACAQGIECLRNYAKKWDEKRKVFEERPFHNWASHGADAMRYLAVTYKERTAPQGDRYARAGRRRGSAWAA